MLNAQLLERRQDTHARHVENLSLFGIHRTVVVVVVVVRVQHLCDHNRIVTHLFSESRAGNLHFRGQPRDHRFDVVRFAVPLQRNSRLAEANGPRSELALPVLERFSAAVSLEALVRHEKIYLQAIHDFPDSVAEDTALAQRHDAGRHNATQEAQVPHMHQLGDRHALVDVWKLADLWNAVIRIKREESKPREESCQPPGVVGEIVIRWLLFLIRAAEVACLIAVVMTRQPEGLH